MTEDTTTQTSTFQMKIGKKTYIITAKPSLSTKRTIDDAFKAFCKKEIATAASSAA